MSMTTMDQNNVQRCQHIDHNVNTDVGIDHDDDTEDQSDNSADDRIDHDDDTDDQSDNSADDGIDHDGDANDQ